VTQLPGSSYVPVVFLDTNAVHFAKLTLSFGTAKNVDVLAVEWDKVRTELENHTVGPAAIESYEKGFWTLRYLHKRSTEPVKFYYSPVTRLELLCGSLRGEAIKKAVQSGVPNRWYSRLEEKDIRLHLEPHGYTQVTSEHQNVDQQFDTIGIILTEQELDRDVWRIARALLESIFVDVQDCLVFASAFLLQANELLTIDGYLRELVRWTQNPGSANADFISRFTTVRTALVDVYAELSGWDKAKVILPEARSVQQMKQFLAGGAS
jgi:hypothetical protein